MPLLWLLVSHSVRSLQLSNVELRPWDSKNLLPYTWYYTGRTYFGIVLGHWRGWLFPFVSFIPPADPDVKAWFPILSLAPQWPFGKQVSTNGSSFTPRLPVLAILYTVSITLRFEFRAQPQITIDFIDSRCSFEFYKILKYDIANVSKEWRP